MHKHIGQRGGHILHHFGVWSMPKSMDISPLSAKTGNQYEWIWRMHGILHHLKKNRCATYTVSHLADVFARRTLWGVVCPILLGRRKTRHVDIRQIGCCDGLRACLSQCLGSSSLLDRAKKLRWDGELIPISSWQQPRMIRSYSGYRTRPRFLLPSSHNWSTILPRTNPLLKQWALQRWTASYQPLYELQ